MDTSGGSAWRASSAFASDDEIVRELDVHCCSSALDEASKVYLLQFPLRPPDRPFEGVDRVRLKPKVQRMQWDLKLDSRGPNWTSHAPEPVHIKTSTLNSTSVDPDMQGLAVGFLHGDALYILPVDEVMQLRHSASYLDKEKEREKKEKAAAEAAANGSATGVSEDDAKELQPLKVTVNKYETEQQVEARLRSYAYLAALEEADSWVELKHRAADSERAAETRGQLPIQAAVVRTFPHMFSRSGYLDAIVPGACAPSEHAPVAVDLSQRQHNQGGAAQQLGRPAPEAYIAAGPGVAGASPLEPEAAAVLPSAVQSLFAYAPVLSLDLLRSMLVKYCERMDGKEALHHAAQTASDASLHAAVVADGSLLCLRGVYMPRALRDPGVDPLRGVLLEVLAEREAVRKKDLQAAAELRGVAFAEGVYQRVMKLMCTSSGSVWRLKTGASSEAAE